MRIGDALVRMPRSALLALCSVLVLVVGLADYATGPELMFSDFYLIPIAVASWYRSRRSGMLMAVLSTLTWLTIDAASSPSPDRPLLAYHNAVMNLIFYVIVAYALSGLRASRQMQVQLTEFIVHDLRSPLITQMVGLKALRGAALGGFGERHVRLLDIATISANRMMTLINSLLDLARLEHRRMPVQLRTRGVMEMLKVSLDQVSLWADDLRIPLRVDIEPDALLVYADAELTSRVLVNLVSNAIKHSPPRAPVEITVRSCGDGKVRFSVSDQGPGVPREYVSRVFDRFHQVRARQGGAAVGTGLGLTFCRLAIEAQSGTISLESTPHVLTTFSFVLPARAPQVREGGDGLGSG